MLNGFGDVSEIETLRTELESKHDVRAGYHGADLATPAEIRALMAQTIERFGAVDILVNNAGFQFVSPDRGISRGEMGRDGGGEFVGGVSHHQGGTPRYAKPEVGSHHQYRLGPRAGRVSVQVGPMWRRSTGWSVSRKSRHWKPRVTHITCNAICPGFVHTAVVDKQIDEQARVTGVPRDKVIEEVILAKHPTREFVRIDQVAAFVLFLCSDAGSSTTGAALSMDGAWSTI